MGGKRAVEALEWVAATDENPHLSQEAIEQIAQVGTSISTSALIRLTADRRLRDASINTLTRKVGSIETIGKALRESNIHVRKAMVDVLARMKHPEASTVLLTALDDEDASIRLSAVSAFGRLGSHRADRKLVEVAHRDTDPVVKEAARTLLLRSRAS
jgi:HEAT repeat protein